MLLQMASFHWVKFWFPPWPGAIFPSVLPWFETREPQPSARSFLWTFIGLSFWTCSREHTGSNIFPFTSKYRLTQVIVNHLRVTESSVKQSCHPSHLGYLLRHHSTGRTPSQLVTICLVSRQARCSRSSQQMLSPPIVSIQICWWELALETALVLSGSNQHFCQNARHWRQTSSEEWVYSWLQQQQQKENFFPMF